MSLDWRKQEAMMVAKEGDWIVTGVNVEKHPVKPDIFEKTYTKLDEPPIAAFVEL